MSLSILPSSNDEQKKPGASKSKLRESGIFSGDSEPARSEHGKPWNCLESLENLRVYGTQQKISEIQQVISC